MFYDGVFDNLAGMKHIKEGEGLIETNVCRD